MCFKNYVLFCGRYPLKRHLVTPKMQSVKLIGHRGGAGEGYENTGHAYNNAVNLGVGMLELDVHLTKVHLIFIFVNSLNFFWQYFRMGR